MISRPATRQHRTSLARARNPIQTASILVLLVAVASLQWPAPPVAGQAGPDLPAVQQAPPSESNAPSADTDLWRLDDVRVVETECYQGNIIREEYGVFGLKTLSVDSDCEEYGDKAQLRGTMEMSYPDLMQGGQPATFSVETNGSMQWEGTDPNGSAKVTLQTEMYSRRMSGGKSADSLLCSHIESPSKEGGATGSATLEVGPLTCTYDPAVDFSGVDEAQIWYRFFPSVGGRFPYFTAGGIVTLTYKRCTNPDDCEPPEIRRPVLILPGIIGSYYSDTANHQPWVLNRGVHPNLLVLDPLTHAYDDLVQTLKNVGYVEGKDLFVVAYDWRLTPGPVDGKLDGHLDGLSAGSITDTEYQYGVDYLGFWLKRAAVAWQTDHPGKTLEAVDVISHSTGGLVARSYIQSDAYGANFTSQGKTMHLPLINNLIMVAVPNRGASQPWQAMSNNFIIDNPSKYVISKMLNVAYQKVKGGQTISGFPQPITPASIRDSSGGFSPAKFINQYVPTFRSLLATYDFYVGADGVPTNLNAESIFRNDLLLDLNNGLDMPDRLPAADSSPFADQVGKATVIYADNQSTAYRVREMVGPASNARFPLDAWFEQDVPASVVYYADISAVLGDGTVPKESLVGQFEGDSRVSRVRVLSGDTTHKGLMANPLVQQRILDTLGAEWLASDISTSLAGKSPINIWNVTSDPVEMFLVDGSGRRLGYSQGTGPVTEIPNSVWYGGADGIGWVFDAVQGPLSVEMTGLGEDYYVQVSGEQVGMTGGVEASGTLVKGKMKTVQVETQLRGTRTFLPMIQRNN